MQLNKEHLNAELYGELGQALNFTYGDLETNRAGFITYRQKELQWQSLRESAKIVLKVGIACFAVITPLQFFLKDPMKSVLFWGMLLGVGLTLAILLMVAFRIISEINQGQVAKLRSTVKIELRHVPKQGELPFLVTSEREFRLPKITNASLWKPDAVYQIFYLPENKIILSMEEVISE